MKAILIILAVLAITAFGSSARADARINWNADGQSFPSEQKTSEAKTDFRAEELLILHDNRKRRIRMKLDWLRNGDFMISDDGRTVIWILKSFTALSIAQDGSTPVLAVFVDEKEVMRATYKEIGSFKLEHTVSHTHWLESYAVNFKQKSIRLKELGFFGKRVVVDWENIKITDAGGERIQDPHQPDTPDAGLRLGDVADSSQTTIEATLELTRKFAEEMKTYSDEMQKVADWYREENRKLAEKVDSMTDEEVNKANEKLTAEYNRKLIKLQAKMPVWPKNSK